VKQINNPYSTDVQKQFKLKWLKNLVSSMNNPCSWIFRNETKLAGIATKPKLDKAQRKKP
jgi:hypothetical protein